MKRLLLILVIVGLLIGGYVFLNEASNERSVNDILERIQEEREIAKRELDEYLQEKEKVKGMLVGYLIDIAQDVHVLDAVLSEETLWKIRVPGFRSRYVIKGSEEERKLEELRKEHDEKARIAREQRRKEHEDEMEEWRRKRRLGIPAVKPFPLLHLPSPAELLQINAVRISHEEAQRLKQLVFHWLFFHSDEFGSIDDAKRREIELDMLNMVLWERDQSPYRYWELFVVAYSKDGPVLLAGNWRVYPEQGKVLPTDSVMEGLLRGRGGDW